LAAAPLGAALRCPALDPEQSGARTRAPARRCAEVSAKMRRGDLETELDHELRAERHMLEHARRCLAIMRRRAESLTASSGGDWVSEEVLHWRIQQRIASLADDGSSGLFFGRIDYDSTAELPDARFYLGRRHVVDDQGDPVVIDWRARLAHPFYRATPVTGSACGCAAASATSGVR
jgi:DNA helicase IV